MRFLKENMHMKYFYANMNSVVVYFQNKQTNKLSLLSLFDSSLHPLADDWEYSTSSLCFFLQQSSHRMCEHQQQNVITAYYVLHMKCEVQFREFNGFFFISVSSSSSLS